MINRNDRNYIKLGIGRRIEQLSKRLQLECMHGVENPWTLKRLSFLLQREREC